MCEEGRVRMFEGSSDSDPVEIQDEPRMEFRKRLGSKGSPQ